MKEAIQIIASKGDASGRWALGIVHADEVVAEPEAAEGKPSRWNTLRALRVLNWHDAAPPRSRKGRGLRSGGRGSALGLPYWQQLL
jgi:hypothetical protein